MIAETVKTANGISTFYNLDAKRIMLGRISDAMSIRNLNQKKFSKELNTLLLKYKL